MEFLRAFTYMFRDQHWLIKLAETALLVVLCPLPVIGLLCLCALLGYLAEIIHNVSSDYPRPLPEWDHIGEDIGKGAHVFLAIAVYHLPPSDHHRVVIHLERIAGCQSLSAALPLPESWRQSCPS